MHADISYGDQHLASVEDDGKVTVTFNGGDAWSCAICGEEFTEEGDAEGEECLHGECVVHTRDDTRDDTGDDTGDDDHDCSFPHELAKNTEPFSWANEVRVVLDEEKDQVELAISIGDIRGAFVMRLYRNTDGAIRMEVPYPGKGGLHLPLRYLNEGFYGVGEVTG